MQQVLPGRQNIRGCEYLVDPRFVFHFCYSMTAVGAVIALEWEALT
jgi:hypothetical protein